MKKMVIILFIITLCVSLKAQQRNVLVEVFTNSHCPLCPPAHTVLDNYRETSPNAARVNFIFYHMSYPYSDDPLYQADKGDSDARNLYYGPFGSTPNGFFDGKIQSHSYSDWPSKIDNELNVSSNINLSLTGSKENGGFTVNADIAPAGGVSASDLMLHFVVVENVSYRGRNDVSPQYYVMRKMLPGSGGEQISLGGGAQKVSQSVTLESGWIPDSISVVVFIQSKSTREVYQSARISYSSLNITGVEKSKTLPEKFSLEQNYPNPFNPSTVIRYGLPEAGRVSLDVYNSLGVRVATLVNAYQNAGLHEVEFNSRGIDGRTIASGIYFYRLRAGNYSTVKKMILLK